MDSSKSAFCKGSNCARTIQTRHESFKAACHANLDAYWNRNHSVLCLATVLSKKTRSPVNEAVVIVCCVLLIQFLNVMNRRLIGNSAGEIHSSYGLNRCRFSQSPRCQWFGGYLLFGRRAFEGSTVACSLLYTSARFSKSEQ